MVDFKAAREVYYEEIIDDIISIRRKYNPTATTMKAAVLPEFIAAIEKINYNVI